MIVERFSYMIGMTGTDRGLCALCGSTTGRRAVFYDRARLRDLCARCAVAKVTKASEGRIEMQRRALR